jgi:hypothetical protein
MNFQRGFVEAVTGIIGGIIISALLAAFAEEGLIPSFLVILFTIVGFLASIALFFTFRFSGIVFTLGWIIGAVMLKDLLGPTEFIFYLVSPIVALIIGVVLLIKGSSE